MNGFALHNIKHTSPSQINTWCNAPDVWILEKLLGRKSKTSCAMMRGTLIENAVVNVLANGHTMAQAVDIAYAGYDKTFCLYNEPNKEKEREAIAPCVELAVKELEKYGKPDFNDNDSQFKVELLCKGDGWDLPVIGYTDFVYKDHGLIVDLKTTLRMPSTMSPEHQRQAAIYAKANGNHRVLFLYVTPKKAQWLEPDDINASLAEAKTILSRQERFLRLSADPLYLASIVPVMPNTFYYNSPEMQAHRKDVYGI